MSAKFKPRTKQTQAIVEDWDTSDPEEDKAQEPGGVQKNTQQHSGTQDPWDKDQARPWTQGKKLWEDANSKTVHSPQPSVLGARTLPTSILAPQLTAQTSQEEYASRPPPQILRREKPVNTGPGSASSSQQRPKTLQEREQEYRKARERIFGTPPAEDNRRTASPSASTSGSRGGVDPKDAIVP